MEQRWSDTDRGN